MILVSSMRLIAMAIVSLAPLLPAVCGQCTLQCANGGICSIDSSTDQQFCTCLQGFQGELCDSKADISCSICSNGTQSFNTHKFIPYLDMTCLEFELFAVTGDDQQLCSLARKTASWCECPGAEKTCSLCPDGTNLINSDLMVPDYSGLSCSDYVFFAAIVPEGPDCASFDFLAEFCGGCVEAPTITLFPTNTPSTSTRTPSPTIATPISSTFSPTGTSSPMRTPSPTIATSISSTFSPTGTPAPTRTLSPTGATSISSTFFPAETSAPTRTPSPTIVTSISSTFSPTGTSAPTRTLSPTIATSIEPSENPTSNSPHLGVMTSTAFLIGSLVLLL